ncbi:hypothetical protein, partial [Erwinia sp. OLCASP19]|uniref:hypothetical protein n=1 Tax=Erwinia sp. OLCASP19 TaxID=1912594 RepID=UPI001A7E0B70
IKLKGFNPEFVKMVLNVKLTGQILTSDSLQWVLIKNRQWECCGLVLQVAEEVIHSHVKRYCNQAGFSN